MNQELIDMAKAAGFEQLGHTDNDWVCYPEDIEAFAKLVAKHTLMNIDPSKFISCQEVMEAARLAEREACAKLCEEPWQGSPKGIAESIRARGEKK